ncbi:MAG: hypothetical protein JRF72_05895, partial [Deltaproteobacteria bacterium]|nr:hypothetical protein [Deltaproteobacteria bacterium]
MHIIRSDIIDIKYNISALENRIKPSLFVTVGLAVVFILAVTGLCRAFNTADLPFKDVGDGGYKLETSAAPYRVYFPDALDSPVRLTSREHQCEFTLGEMSYNAGEDHLGRPRPVAKETGDAAVVYPDAFENVDIEYQLTTRGIKEFFVLKKRPRAPAGQLPDPTLDFTETIDAGDLRLYLEGVPAPDNFTTHQSLAFVDEASGETVFVLPAPYAIDAAGAIIPTRYKVQTRGNIVRLYTQTPYAWLSDPARVYPVKIDPSATIDSNTDGYSITLWYGDDTQWDTSAVSGGWEDWWILIIYHVNSYRSGIDFDTTVIPDTATITKVELKLYVNNENNPP